MRRLLRRAEDWVRYDAWPRHVLSWVPRWQDRRPAATDQELARSVVRLCAAARLAGSDALQAALQERIRARLDRLNPAAVDLSEFFRIDDPAWLSKAAILKPYLGPTEKGVVFVSFEREWIKLARLEKMREFAERYTLVVSPSSSPHNLINYLFPRIWPERYFSLISNPEDLVVLPRVSDRFEALPLYASQWVNPDLFEPRPHAERNFDLLMVASFGKVKRHHVLFRALRRMPRRLRILLIGQDQEGRTADTIRQEARWYGVADRFELRADQKYPQVCRAFCDARASLVLSRREGSCVVVTESFFADTPVALLEGAVLGSRVFLNDRTGVFLRERDLARGLTRFLEEADRFSPRAWALETISCYKSTKILNDLLRERALARGAVWTTDLAPLQWSPDPRLAREDDRRRLEAERRDILIRFGLRIGMDL